jgi:uncharacterized protein YndB with AHSA1/START domain
MSTQRYLLGELARKGSTNRDSHARWDFSISFPIHADPRSIFNALTIPEYLEAWLRPPTCRSASAARDGSKYLLQFQNCAAPRIAVRGAWVSLRPDRLSLTWNRSDAIMDVESILSVELRECAGRTRLHLYHSGFTTAEQSLWHGELWNASIHRLAGLLESAAGPSGARVSAVSSLHRPATLNRRNGRRPIPREQIGCLAENTHLSS